MNRPSEIHTIRGTLGDRWMRIVDGVAIEFYYQAVDTPDGMESWWTGPDRVMSNYLEENGFTFVPRKLDGPRTYHGHPAENRS